MKLGDCHIHVIMDGINYREAMALHKEGVDDKVIEDCFQGYEMAGITFLRDGGDAYHVSMKAKQYAAKYGIDYRSPLFAIHRKGHYGGIVGRSFTTEKEYASLVEEVKKSGGDFIKIMVSGLIDFSKYGALTEEGLTKSEINMMIHIAHEEGFAVMAHCNGARTMEYAANAGCDTIEHGAYPDREALLAMKENHTIWTPTLAPAINLIGCGRFPDEVLCKLEHNQKKYIKCFDEMGGRIALGSDGGAYRVPHVKGTKDEEGYLTEIVPREHLLQTQNLIEEKFRLPG